MDWNKTNTILIIAFLIVNIFLFCFIYLEDNFIQRGMIEENEEFIQNVKNILKSKNISILCEIPKKEYKAPFLDIKYDIIYPSEALVENFIGEYGGIINDEILFYQSNNKSLEILGRKKIIYINENNSSNEIKNTQTVDNIIKDFCIEKNIGLDGFVKVDAANIDGANLVRFVEKYKGYNLENSYMNFYIENGIVTKFEMQKVVDITERAYEKSISAGEALLRLMTMDNIKDKDISNIEICYYTSEDKDFENINSINVDLVWKITFDDNSFVYLIREDY